ncbi:MAG: formate--tetrahydrofolate ligase [Dehalococcoidia bacterium]
MTALTTDLAIARSVSLRPIAEVAAELGLLPEETEPYGRTKLKVSLDALDRLGDAPLGKYIDVTAITPTPLGEGKTTTTVGLAQGLCRIGKRALAAVRQPSLGPVFGIKGGAAGGGWAQIVPMEDINLHLTGDMHAIGIAHNLCAAFLDNHLHHGNALGIDVRNILWRRVLDANDRALRNIVIGLGGNDNGIPRETGFDITSASELQAVLGLATGMDDLRERIGRIVVATTRDGQPITAEDLKVAGAMAVLLKDALMPNLLQTLEGGPAFVHTGPFGNIAHGNSSIIADQLGLRLAEYVVTESGFGVDLGCEKFMNIKCRASGLRPDAVVLVATIRALKAHSGRYRVVAGKPLDPRLLEEDLDSLEIGAANLIKQIENVRLFGVPVVVAVNKFTHDTAAEVALVRQIAEQAGADAAVVSDHWTYGGAGAVELAEAVVAAAEKPSNFRFLYELDVPVKQKIETVATQIYGAAGVSYLPAADRAIRRYERLGYGGLPICMAKTHLSLSHDPTLLGAPSGFTVTVRDVRLSAGAGFLYPLLGEMRTMPGLPRVPAGEAVDLDEEGVAQGLF